jgi:hypothetical protein
VFPTGSWTQVASRDTTIGRVFTGVRDSLPESRRVAGLRRAFGSSARITDGPGLEEERSGPTLELIPASDGGPIGSDADAEESGSPGDTALARSETTEERWFGESSFLAGDLPALRAAAISTPTTAPTTAAMV